MPQSLPEYDPKVIEPRTLIAACGGDVEALLEVLTVALEDLEVLVPAVVGNCKPNAARDGAVAALHALAGALGSSCAVESTLYARQLEEQIRHGGPMPGDAEVELLVAAVDRFRVQARVILGS